MRFDRPGLQTTHSGGDEVSTSDVPEEMQKYFLDAKARAEQIEDERDRMIQLAGVGLMLEAISNIFANLMITAGHIENCLHT